MDNGTVGRRPLSNERFAMKMFRYRAPSMKTVFGVTAAKRSVKRDLGITQVQAWTEPSRVKQKVNREGSLFADRTGHPANQQGSFPDVPRFVRPSPHVRPSAPRRWQRHE
jgi:hypothetical protein